MRARACAISSSHVFLSLPTPIRGTVHFPRPGNFRESKAITGVRSKGQEEVVEETREGARYEEHSSVSLLTGSTKSKAMLCCPPGSTSRPAACSHIGTYSSSSVDGAGDAHTTSDGGISRFESVFDGGVADEVSNRVYRKGVYESAVTAITT
ncbi:hypothetical protein B0H14DRAFT_3153175 [Mycena olivaceomarginata]|nr:hypothetical protein B0H14DRAFT_3153175 [Mycena olivaceomarginata]